MSPSPQVSAAAASDAYKDRNQSDIGKPVLFNGHEYSVLKYRNDSTTGFHATAYKEVAPPHNVIIAYRGTDPNIVHHTRTTFQDAAVDATMVKDQVNPQEKEARAFTQEILDKAQEHGISKDQITVAGHSLGGTLAEIEAAKFGLRGATFNAYGAVDLGYGVPAGGHQLTNYVMAGDLVSAASHHFGEMKVLASKDDIQALEAARYLNAPSGAPPPNPLLAMRLGDHSINNFVPTPDVVNVLAPANMQEYESRYENNKTAIEHYRNDVYIDRAELAVALRDPDNRNIETTLANLSPQLQRQLMEFHATKIDTPVQFAVEHNRVIDSAEQGLDQTSLALRVTGQTVQALDEHTANDVRRASGYAALVMPDAPMIGIALAEGAHLHGQAAQAASQFAADQVQGAKHVVEQGAHVTAQVATTSVHAHEARRSENAHHP